jgi:hypothetical protein
MKRSFKNYGLFDMTNFKKIIAESNLDWDAFDFRQKRGNTHKETKCLTGAGRCSQRALTRWATISGPAPGAEGLRVASLPASEAEPRNKTSQSTQARSAFA